MKSPPAAPLAALARAIQSFAILMLAAGVTGAFSGCSSMERIDARTDALLREVTAEIGGDGLSPEPRRDYLTGTALSYPGEAVQRPLTLNPAAAEIEHRFTTREAMIQKESEQILGRLDADDAIFAEDAEEDTLRLDIRGALALAQESAREYRRAEEEYVLSALRLLVERHLWGPRFFDEISATVAGAGDRGHFDTALRLVNEFRVSQRLPYGGEVSARMLARATEDLHSRVSGPNVQSAEIIIAANVPLLRGAGLAAREPRIQAERDLIYSARDFELFRRQFLVSIASDFLNLVVQQQAIRNAEAQLRRLRDFEQRQRGLADAGRQPAFDIALAEQDVLFAQDNLRRQQEAYRFAVDRFKVRLGLPVDLMLVIEDTRLDLPVPDIGMDEAVRLALRYRLDLQTRRDRVDDARRRIDIARNNLLPDLVLGGNVSIPTDRDRDRAGLRFDPDDASFAAGITFGLPLDREIERVSLRQAQISHERSQRDYDEFRDSLVIRVRDSVREIERALFSLRLQEENIRIATRRLQAIEAAPDRATARDRSDAADGLTRAEDQRDRANRDLEVAILEYLLNTGILRVDRDGTLLPLPGMDSEPDPATPDIR